MNQMKLYGMLESLQNLLARSGTSGTQDLGPTELFGLAVDAEWTYRENQKTKRLLTGAHFKEKTACIEALDYRAGRGLKKSIVTELTQNHWISGHQNIVITGPAGSGKSFLAQALGHHAARFGFSVQYLRMPKLLFSLLQSRADGSYLNLLKRLGKTQILILDDWGLTALGEQERQDLLEISKRFMNHNFRSMSDSGRIWDCLAVGSQVADVSKIAARRSKSSNVLAVGTASKIRLSATNGLIPLALAVTTKL
jgi:DNA replication protein DnaC